MFSFKYRPCDYAKMRKVVVDDSLFNRLGCSAAYFSVQQFGDSGNDCTVNLVLWSYETPIMVVDITHERMPEHPTREWETSFTIFVNGEMWDCSATTIRHISRFMRMIAHEEDLSCTFSYHMIKDAMNLVRSHTREYVECYSPNTYPYCNVQIARCTSLALSNYLESFNAPRPVGTWLEC